MLNRIEKEKLLGQKGLVIWMTGLSGAGKTTIGVALENHLHNDGVLTQLLDGDIIREGLNNNLGFSDDDRKENIRRIAETAKLFVNCGVITICCFVSPTNEIRNIAKKIIGEKDFIEVYINASLETCEKRDVKGLYAKARRGEIKNFTGIGSPYEIPLNPHLEIKTNEVTLEEGAKKIIDYISKHN